MKLIKQSVVLAFVLSVGTIVAAPEPSENAGDSSANQANESKYNADLQSSIEAGNESRRSANPQIYEQNSESPGNLSSSADESDNNANPNANLDPDLSILISERFRLH